MVTDAAYYQRLLESFYDGLGGLSTAGYEYSSSDAWTQGRHAVTPDHGFTQHLECWVDLGSAASVERSRIQHDAALLFACRYAADDDSLSQARIHAAARAAVAFLLGWSHPTGERARPTGYVHALADEGQWVLVSVFFNLQIPRG